MGISGETKRDKKTKTMTDGAKIKTAKPKKIVCEMAEAVGCGLWTDQKGSNCRYFIGTSISRMYVNRFSARAPDSGLLP